MARILVTYASMAGSTAEVAERITQALKTDGVETENKPISAIAALEAYDAVVVAAPMILGWHRDAQQFVARFASQLAKLPVAYCITCYEFTDTGADTVQGVPITVDPNLRGEPKDPAQLSFKEKQTTAAAYLRPALNKAPGVKPVDVGFFKGKIDYGQLSLFPMLFVRLLIRAKSGDYRNWDAITAWTADVRGKLLAGQ